MACPRSKGLYSPEQLKKIDSMIGKMKVLCTRDTEVATGIRGKICPAKSRAGNIKQISLRR
jgi:hypothetical protein